jgi:hypothetical protein
MPAGKEFGRVGGAFVLRAAEARYDFGPRIRYRCREYSRTEETSAAALCVSIRKLEVTKMATARGSRLENVNVTFLLLRRALLSPLKGGMIMIVGSTGSGRL